MPRPDNPPITNGYSTLSRLRQIAIITAISLLIGTCATQGPLQPFTTDGCSRFPDRNPVTKEDWCGCCVVHDMAYWRGGTEQERLAADKALRACVEKTTGDKKLAETMFIGVRAGGGPEFNTPYRWGYGWPFGRGYKALSDAEKKRAEKMEQQYREKNPALICPR